jgi:hypothetical protein
MKRSWLIGGAVFALAALPALSAAAMPRTSARASVSGPDSAVILAHADHGHAWNHTLRVGRDRDDAWSGGLRRFRNTFDR